MYGMIAQMNQKPQAVTKPQPVNQITPTDPSAAFGGMATKPMQTAVRGNPAGGHVDSMGAQFNKPGAREMIAPAHPGLPSGGAGMMGQMAGQFGGPQMGSSQMPDMSGLQGQMQNMRGIPAGGGAYGGYQPQPRDVAQRMMASRMLGRPQITPQLPPDGGVISPNMPQYY